MQPRNVRVTAAEAARIIPSVSRHLIATWRIRGHIKPCGQRGRSPLYDWRQILAVEAEMRMSEKSHRGPRRQSTAA